ncbi:CAP-Gly domain-containing linker protein 3 [Geodia barretti]|uniref:CAP-Gly domain-containing linker protein 3 n=3 Tax=Geodia barretti TaxID=519541 RepID=A0AA35X7W7_GEOBA|nr:CAP-Gly domain-containing linker protein 3 [Geodia barretti]
MGTVRFGGAIDFLGGQWAGIELDDAVGKNDGSLKGIRFFTCKPKFGLFVPMQRISKAPMRQLSTERRKKMAANGGRKRESVPLSPRTFEAQGTMAVSTDLQVGERVSIEGNGTGTLRYVGSVKFAPG